MGRLSRETSLIRTRHRGLIWLASAGFALAGSGCALMPTGSSPGFTAGARMSATATAPASDLFAPAPPANGFDPQRAQATLAEVPDDPPAPKSPGANTEPELPRQAVRHLEEARRLFGEQRYSETVIEVEKTLRYHQDVVEAHRLAALASLIVGKNSQAQAHADAALALKSDDLACRYVRGRLAEKSEQADVALAEYRTALKCPVPVGSEQYRTLVHHQLGLLLYEMGYYRAAIDQFTTFESEITRATADSSNPDLATILRAKRAIPLLALANAHEALRQYGPAADAQSSALQHAAENTALRVRYIKNLVRAKRFDEARAEAIQHAEASHDRPSAELLLAVHRAAGRKDQGLAAIERLVAEHAGNSDLGLFYADALIDAERFDQAIKTLNELAERGTETAAARWKLVSIHRARGNHREWIWAVGAQLASDPGDLQRALNELAELPKQDAARLIANAMEPTSAPASQPDRQENEELLAGYYYCLGRLADRLNRVEDAERLYARALQTRPDFILASIGTAELWIDRCQWDKALAALDRAGQVEDAVQQASLERLYARCYDGLDDLEKATNHYRQALKKHPRAETCVLLGRLLDRFQKYKEAAEALEQAVQLDPELIEAREMLCMNLLNRWREGDNLKQLLAQMKEMQDKAPDHPATTRTTALVRLLMRQPPDLDGYVRVLTSLVEAQPEDRQSRRALAVGLIRMADYDAAIRELRKLLDDTPCDPEANELTAVALMRRLSIDEAAQQLARTLEWYPNREGLLRNLAEVRLVQQDYPAALSLWQKVLSLQTNAERHPAYRGRVVSTCLLAGWHDKLRAQSKEWLDDADEAEVDTIRSYLLAADAAEGKYEQYLERCRGWLSEDPKDEQLKQWLLGIGPLPGQATGGLIGADRFDEAVAQAAAWAALSPTDPLAQQTFLETLRAVRRPEDIIEVCRANLSLAENPRQRLGPLQMLADAYLMAERYDEAINAVREMTSQVAQIPEADVSFQLDEILVSYLAQAKRYDDALVQANRMISGLDEKEARLQQVIAQHSDDPAIRVQVLQAQEKIREQRADVLRSMSFVYTKQDRRDQAIECLKQALKLAPNDAGLNNDLGYTLADAGIELNEAQRMLKAAVSEVLWVGVGQDGRQAAFMDSLGWLYYKQGQFEQAQRWLALGAKMEDGQDAVIHDHLGDVEWRLGHRDQAVQSWKRSLELHDRKVEEENADPDEKLVTALKAKLAEAEQGGKPAVATATAD